MEVLLISGFLGAGKTTLVRHLLESECGRFGKVAVLVNEAGEVGIDGALLSGQNVDIVELTSGCICCTIKAGFLQAVLEIHERVRPDFLLVEATGVAQPGELFDILFDRPVSEICRLRSLITVVDASFFDVREALGPFYDNQIRAADVLILNKIDQTGDGELRDIEALLAGMNPGVAILRAQHCSVDLELLLQTRSGGGEKRVAVSEGDVDLRDAGFQTFSFEEERPLEESRLTAFLQSLPPTLFRLKGWVRFPKSSAFVDFAAGNYRIKPTETERATSLAFVGRKCNQAEILASLTDCVMTDATGAGHS